MIVDNDSHINEPMEIFEQYLEVPYHSRRPRLIKDTLGLTRILLEGKLYPDLRLKQAHRNQIQGQLPGQLEAPRRDGVRPGATDPLARLSDLDQEGIEFQIIFGSLGLALSALPDPDFAVAMARACNNYYADFCRLAPDRLKCMAALPLQDIPSSVAEMRRAIEQLGHTGITMPPNVNGKHLDHSDFYPIYELAEQLEVPIGIHWGNGADLAAAGGERFNPNLMAPAGGHPFEQMIALTSVICGGVLERFPRLRFAFFEAGCGWLPHWMQRLQEQYQRRHAKTPLMKKGPIEYLLDGACFFTTEPDEVLLPATIREYGDEFILFGSNYPHTDGQFPHSVQTIRERSEIPETSKEKILSNGAKFIGLEERQRT